MPLSPYKFAGMCRHPKASPRDMSSDQLRCTCGEPAAAFSGWPFPTPVCDGSKPVEHKWPFGTMKRTYSCPRPRWPDQIPEDMVVANAMVPSAMEHMVSQLAVRD
jgi:hypothetical protein